MALLLALFLICVSVLCSGNARAQGQTDLQAMHDATLQAFQSGDANLALSRAQQAMEVARGLRDPDPQAFAYALNNVAFLTAANAPDGARSLWEEALSYLSARGLRASEAGLSIALQLAGLDAQQGNVATAESRVADVLRLARGTPLQARAAGAAAGLLLQMGAYQDAVVAFSEMAALNPELIRATYGTAYVDLSQLADQAEADGRVDDLAALIQAKIIIARAFIPESDQQSVTRNLQFQRYFALHQAGQYDRARDALTVWLTSGPLSADEQDFVNSILDSARAFGQGAEITSLDELETARTAIAMLKAQDAPDDPAFGQALRAIALAEARFGQFERATLALTDAIAILERSAAGRVNLPLAQAELAWYLHLLGASDQAAALFALSDAAPVAPQPPLDKAEAAINRARFHMDLGQTDAARDWLHKAQADIDSGDPGIRQAALRVRMFTLIATLASETGANEGTADLQAAIDKLRALGGGSDIEFAMALTNAADALALTGAFEPARDLLDEAAELNRTSLPATAPQALDALAMLQQLNLLLGDQDAVTETLRTVTEARKAPAYRAYLPENAWDFELFAWALLAAPDARTPDRLDEAFQALQWTQITQSAEALSALETRLAVDDPARGALLRERQDLATRFEQTQANLAAARSASDQAQARTLERRLSDINTGLVQVNDTLDSMGVTTGTVGQVSPMTIRDVQDLLSPSEALVTFLLPSLNPDVIPAVDGSSNHAIVVTRDAVHIEKMRAFSRRGLNADIDAFRCQMAISDPACDVNAFAGLRGAMLEGEDAASEPPFDFAAAHELYLDLFGSVDTVLSEHPDLIIVPPGDLLRLPFSALVTSVTSQDTLRDADWLIRRNTLSILPSISSLRTLRGGVVGTQPMRSMFGIGDPVIGSNSTINCDTMATALRGMPPLQSPLSGTITPDGLPLADVEFLANLPRLPDARCELEAIQTAFDTSSVVITGAEANETRIKALDAAGELAKYDVLVFATHGLTAGEAGARSPGLVLTPPDQATDADDGLLTASEIATLDLNAALVVLSACNTAAGDGGDSDGLSGLARAFFQSGAKALLVTHWSVFSEAAVDVSTGLFGALAENPSKTQAQAFQSSILRILDDPTRPGLHYHPSYWAAFAMIGAR